MRTPLALVLDLVLVVVFAITGRASHAETLDVAGVFGTAWPFLAALLVAWGITTVVGWDPRTLKAGGLIWLVTLVGGMGLRGGTGGGTALAFIIVAGVTLALFLVGWRAISARVTRRTDRQEQPAR